jgi:hypothetical protein
MNDDLNTTLDERASAAAADLRARAGARPVPAFDPERAEALPAPLPTSTVRSRRPLLAVAAAVVLVAGAAAWWSSTSGPDDSQPATRTTGNPRPYVATDLPDGFELTGVADLDGSDTGGAEGPLALFGPSADRPGLGVAFQPDYEVSDDGEQGDRIDVGGREAYSLGGKGLGRNVVVVAEGSGGILLVSPTLDAEALARLAAEVTVDGTTVTVDPAALPDGWGPLATDAAGFGGLSPMAPMRGAGSGATVNYAKGAKASIIVTSTPGDQDAVFTGILLADRFEELEVRGHRAVLTTVKIAIANSPDSGDEPTDLTMTTLTWLEAPGELVRVTGIGLGRDELVLVAEGVEPAGSQRWAELLKRSRLGDLGGQSDPKSRVLGEGTFADGTAWKLRYTPASDDGSMASTSLTVATDGLSGSSSSSSGTAIGSGSGSDPGEGILDPFPSMEVLDHGDRHFASGLLAGPVATVELRRPDGSVIGRATVVTAEGVSGWVAELTEADTVVVALDAAGTELGRAELGGFGLGTSSDEHGPATTSVGRPGSPTTIVGDAGSGSDSGSSGGGSAPVETTVPVTPGD